MPTPPVPPWRQLDNFSRPAHQRLVEKINEQNQLNLEEQKRRRLDRTVRVKIDSNRTGGELYKAYIFDPPATSINTGSDLAESDLGTQGEEVTVANAQGVGESTHVLIAGDIYNGTFLPLPDTDGNRVVVVNPGGAGIKDIRLNEDGTWVQVTYDDPAEEDWVNKIEVKPECVVPP